jgi:hypothetical protein
MKNCNFNNVSVKKLILLVIAIGCFLPVNVFAQSEKNVDSIITKNTFPLLSYIMEDKSTLKILQKAGNIKNQNITQNKRFDQALQQCQDINCLATAIQWQPDEIRTIGNSLISLYEKEPQMKKLVSNLRESGYYNAFLTLPDTAFLRAMWNSVAIGLNQAADIYLKGKKPMYFAIDAISFAANDPEYFNTIQNLQKKELQNPSDDFYRIPLKMVLAALRLNGRDEATRYEPLNKGMNETAYKNVAGTKWEKYQYSAILVPGQGPEEQGVNIDPLSILRCKLAAKSYNDGLAPFIIVSGGHVHPNKTPFSEAVEMKKYLIKELNVPENVIIIEPHARHTTTNLRNAARIIYRFKFPGDKKILITTNTEQNNLILNMERRCKMELGYVPYKELKKLSEESCEFYPVPEALQCNSKDPLDP